MTYPTNDQAHVYIDVDCLFEFSREVAEKQFGRSTRLSLEPTTIAVLLNLTKKVPSASFEIFSHYDDELSRERMQCLLHTFPTIYFMVFIPTTLPAMLEGFESAHDIILTSKWINGLNNRQQELMYAHYSFASAAKLQKKIFDRIKPDLD